MLNKKLLVPHQSYELQEIYDIVEQNTTLVAGDYASDNSGIKWKHTVRRMLEEVNGVRKICDAYNSRSVQYNGKKTYILS